MYKVYIKDGKITLSIENEVEENIVYSYAFYLFYGDQNERYFYSKESSRTFKMAIQDGSYRAVFFIKNIDQEIELHEKKFLIKNNTIVKIEETLLFEDSNCKITLYDQSSNTTFIVFNSSGSTKETMPFGLMYLLKKGFNVIVCWQNNDQYQGLSFRHFQNIVQPKVKHKKVILYGSSLGGYCSLYYAGAVNGIVIAAAPRNSAHPVIREKFSKKMFENLEFKHKNFYENKLTNNSIYIIIDPYQEQDMFFLDYFIKPVYENIEIIKIPYAGHEVLRHLGKTRQLNVLLDNILKSSEIIDIDSEYTLEIIDIDSEYTLYGKAQYHFQKMRDYLLLVDQIHQRGISVDKKLDILNKNLSKLVK